MQRSLRGAVSLSRFLLFSFSSCSSLSYCWAGLHLLHCFFFFDTLTLVVCLFFCVCSALFFLLRCCSCSLFANHGLYVRTRDLAIMSIVHHVLPSSASVAAVLLQRRLWPISSRVSLQQSVQYIHCTGANAYSTYTVRERTRTMRLLPRGWAAHHNDESRKEKEERTGYDGRGPS